MNVRKTKSGWVLEITNRKGNHLMLGGICGREVLYKRAMLTLAGIDYDADPEGDWSAGISNAECLHRMIAPDRVLRKGTRIE